MAFQFQIGGFPLVRTILLGVALLATTSCNKLRMGYEYADWLIIYSVEDNFDLNKVQRTRLKEDVAAYFKWHRNQMLPKYADFLTWTATGVKDGLRTAEIDSGYARYQVLMRGTMQPVVDKAIIMLGGLTPVQIETWVERQKKKNLKLRKDFSGSAEENFEHRYGKIIEELEDWTGKLTPDQKARIKALNHTLPWNGNLWLDTREKAQDRLADLLRKRASPAELRRFLEEFYLHPEKMRTKEYKVKYKEFEMRMRTMILIIHNMLTPEQKQHFLNQVEKLATDFRTLSQKKKP